MAKSLIERAVEVRKLVEDNPGVRACELAEQTGVSRATLTIVVQELKRQDAIEQVPTEGRGLGLRLTGSERARNMMRRRWR